MAVVRKPTLQGEALESTGTLISGVVDDVKTLGRQYAALVQAEFREKTSEQMSLMKRRLIPLALAGVLGLMALVLFAAMLVVAFYTRLDLPLWASYGLVGGLCLIVALLMAGFAGGGKTEDASEPGRGLRSVGGAT